MFKLFALAPSRTQLVEDSFWKISSYGEAFVNSFYNRFFEMYPQVQPLFEKSAQSQMGLKLLQTLTLIVENLRRPDSLVPMLESLGKRHRTQYRVLAPHYAMLTAALLETLAEFAPDDWSPEMEKAWTDAIDGVTEIMVYQA